MWVSFSYDKLVIACGSTTNTHGVPGLEHCFQLKTISDAQCIRRRIMGQDSFRVSLYSAYLLMLWFKQIILKLPVNPPQLPRNANDC
jgi:hypothetical protein